MSLGVIENSGFIFDYSPEKLSLVMHQVSKGYRASYGKVTLVFTKANLPTALSILPITCGSQTLPFSFVGFDPEDPLKIDAYDGVSFAGQYLRNLADQLSAHPFLMEFVNIRFLFFDTVSELGAIELLAKQIGASYALGFNPPTNLILHPTSTSVLALNGVYPSNLTMKVLVSGVYDPLYNPKYIDFEAIYSVAKFDKNADLATFDFFDLNDMASAYLGFDVPHNVWSPFILRNWTFVFLCKISTLTDTAIYPGFKSAINSFNCNANLSTKKNDIAISASNFNLIADVKSEKISTIYSLEWLLLQISNSENIVTITFDVFYEDNSTKSSSFNLYAPFGLHLCIPTGWLQNNLGDLDKSKVAYKYTVTVAQPAFLFEDVFTYYLDHRIFPFWKQFLFQNAIGYADTFAISGAAKNNLKLKREAYQLANTNETTVTTGTWEVVASTNYDEFTFRSGWLLSKAEHDRYRQILSSKWIGMIDDEILKCDYIDGIATNIPLQPFQKMMVIDDSVAFKEENDFLYSLQFSMRTAFENKGFMDVEKIPELYYDSEICFSCSKTDFASFDDSIEVFVSTKLGGYYTIVLEGNENPNGSFSLKGNDVLYFTVKAYMLDALSITSVSDNATISFSKIETYDLKWLLLYKFSHILETLFQRLQSLLMLEVLAIDSTHYLDGERVLAQVIKLKQEGGKMTDLALTGYTPNALAKQMKSILTNSYSMTVITL